MPQPGAHEAVCPACRRIADDYPAGTVEVRGEFLSKHRREIVNLLRNEEEAENGEHPIERIMRIAETEDGLDVTTTGIHLARRFGNALSRAFQGDLSIQYAEDEKRVRVQWQR